MPPSSAWPTRSAPARTGSSCTAAASSCIPPPSSAEDERAPRTADSAAVIGQLRRLVRCRWALPNAARAASAASATPGIVSSGANRSRFPVAVTARHARRSDATGALDRARRPLAGRSAAVHRAARAVRRSVRRSRAMARQVTTLTAMIEAHKDVPATYPPSAEFAANANATADLYRRRRGRPAGVLVRTGQPAVLGHPLRRSPGLLRRSGSEVVRRRQTQRRLQLRGSACRGGSR